HFADISVFHDKQVPATVQRYGHWILHMCLDCRSAISHVAPVFHHTIPCNRCNHTGWRHPTDSVILHISDKDVPPPIAGDATWKVELRRRARTAIGAVTVCPIPCDGRDYPIDCYFADTGIVGIGHKKIAGRIHSKPPRPEQFCRNGGSAVPSKPRCTI